MLSRLAGLFSPAPVAPPPPAPPPIPDFRKGWDPRHVGNHVFFVDQRNETDSDFYFITEASNQFSVKKSESTLTMIPLSDDLRRLPRQMLLPNFFAYIQENGFFYINEYSKPFDTEITIEGAVQTNTFIVLRVQASKLQLGSILDCLRFQDRPPINVFLQTHFNVNITAGRMSGYGTMFDFCYEIANLKNLYNMAFNNTVTTVEALIANFNGLRNSDEDLIRMSALTPFVGLRDTICFYDFLKIYYISASSFSDGFRALRPDETPTYIRFLQNRLESQRNYQTYLHAFSAVFPAFEIAPLNLQVRLEGLQALIRAKRLDVLNYYLKFINLATFDHDLDESMGLIEVLSAFIRRQLALPTPAPIAFRLVYPMPCMTKYLRDDASYPKILAFQTPIGVVIGIQDTEDPQVEFLDGTSAPLEPLAPSQIPLNPTSIIERFVYVFFKRFSLERIETFMRQPDETIRASFAIPAFSNLQTLGLDLYKDRRRRVLLRDDAGAIHFNEQLFRNAVFLMNDDVTHSRKGSFYSLSKDRLIAQRMGLFYDLACTAVREGEGPVALKRSFFLSPQISLSTDAQRVTHVEELQQNLNNFMNTIERTTLGAFFNLGFEMVLPRFEMFTLEGTNYPAVIDGENIYSTFAWPDLDERAQLARFGFYIPPGTQFIIDLNLEKRYLLTPTQKSAIERFINSRDPRELETEFRSFQEFKYGYACTTYFADVDLLPRLIESTTFGKYLDGLLGEKMTRKSSRLNLYQTGKRLLLAHKNPDGTSKKLLVRLLFSVPDVDVQINVYPNHPCFLQNGDSTVFWPAIITAGFDLHSESAVAIDVGAFNDFFPVKNVEHNGPEPAAPPRRLQNAMNPVEAQRLRQEFEVAHQTWSETFKVDGCTVVREVPFPNIFGIPRDRINKSRFPLIYESLLTQIISAVPRPPTTNILDFYSFGFSNSEALDTYRKIPGASKYMPDARAPRATWRAAGGRRTPAGRRTRGRRRRARHRRASRRLR